MTANTTQTARPASTERGIAYATTAAPLVGAAVAPVLGTDAATAVDLAYLGAAGLLTANIMDALPDGLTRNLPAGDILRAHRLPLFLSNLTTGTALAMGTLMGPAGTDALVAGFAAIGSEPVPGIVSLGWWATVALVPYQLRRILRRPRTRRAHPTAVPVPAKPNLPPDVVEIVHLWHNHISSPDTGSHRDQNLTVTHYTPGLRWKGIITARAGQSVTVREDNVSSVYRRDAAWIHITPGAHAGERHITVHLTAPPDLDPSTLSGAWKKWVAKSGGIMAGTHLEEIQSDPHTGGEVAWVVAGEDIDKLPSPDRAGLAGALRTNTLLCSYSPEPGDPRRGRIRKMKHNPLKKGVPFPGTDVLKISDGGYVQIGRHVSGFPARIQFVDPKLGAKHLFVAGVTGSGKGGLIQIVALADHVNGHAIIYSDPKGSSNPDVETMACFSGTGEDGCMGPLRVAYALMNWRIEESARAKMKNFVATPQRPWVRVILDEAHVPLSELVHYRKEAGIIVEALAAKARSMGIILTIVNQAVNAEKVGGSTALRMNVIQGGSLVMLRSDSGQQHLVTTGFEGVDPGQIPASWDVKRPLVYDEKIAMEDPESTFGLGYTLGPGGAAEMMRDFILESAAPYIDHEAIAHPADWPDWDQRHAIAATSILGEDDQDDDDIGGSMLFTSVDLAPKKPASAAEKILTVLEDLADPAGLETNYAHKDTIGQLAGLEGSTLPNTLSDLVKAGKIHRQVDEKGKEVRGMYGLGDAPATDTEDEEDAA